MLIHGLGGSPSNWGPIVTSFQGDPELQHVKWELPQAPLLPVTANGGAVMPAWFDILSFDFNTEEDKAGMLRSLRSIDAFAAAEVAAGIPSERIVIAGFSQGGGMSILAGMTSARRYAGVSGLSARRAKLRQMRSEHATTLPVFWGHGTRDPLISFELGVSSAAFLRDELGVPTTTLQSADLRGIAFNEYRGLVHAVDDRELDDLRGWMQRVIPQMTALGS
ncbi:lysophospholipase I [Auriscalpium vulgare]|uniref:Lysophospholipase I n=1 Tax=Auriscalpium vulgare TaxID=40419 RepID=A0ACB8RPN7_9AGAM|nr:lysophospholipase I [Auriscalpium vulgare]